MSDRSWWACLSWGSVCVRAPAPAWRSVRWLDQKPVRLLGVTPHRLAARGFPLQTGTGVCLCSNRGRRWTTCLQNHSTSLSASTRTATATSWRCWTRVRVRCLAAHGLRPTAAATGRRCGWPRRVGAGRAWAVEGTGAYGAGLTRFLQRQGERVLEVERPARRGRDGRLKDDGLDALRAGRALLAEQAAGEPRAQGVREGLRCLLVAREAAVAERRNGLNQLRALVLTAPEQ